MSKDATVTTNDPKNPQIQLTVSGVVERFADITPQRVRLFGTVQAPLSATVAVVPVPSRPFRILAVAPRIPNQIDCRLEEKTIDGRPGYLLTVENRVGQPGRYSNQLILKTDSAALPEIIIPVYGQVEAAATQ